MKKLEAIGVPKKEVALHKKALKYALLKEYNQTEKKSFWRGGEYIVKHKLITIGISGFIVIALLFGYAFIGNNVFTPRAEAQEAVQKAFDKFITLSPEEKANLEKKIKADMESSLEEAKNAKDLEVVPESEIQRIDPPAGDEKHVFGIGVGDPAGGPVMVKREEENEGGVVTSTEDVFIEKNGKEVKDAQPGVRLNLEPGKIPAPHGLKVLRYTDPNGHKVILGINEEDKPVMKMIRIEKFEEGKGAMENVKFFHTQR